MCQGIGEHCILLKESAELKYVKRKYTLIGCVREEDMLPYWWCVTYICTKYIGVLDELSVDWFLKMAKGWCDLICKLYTRVFTLKTIENRRIDGYSPSLLLSHAYTNKHIDKYSRRTVTSVISIPKLNAGFSEWKNNFNEKLKSIFNLQQHNKNGILIRDPFPKIFWFALIFVFHSRWKMIFIPDAYS